MNRSARGAPQKIASLRTGGDGGGHVTTSLALDGDRLYAGVGSSCNVCDPELDATRATYPVMQGFLDGRNMHAKAIHIRNPICARDRLAHPCGYGPRQCRSRRTSAARPPAYEIFDAVGAHDGNQVDYGWPHCYENRKRASPEADCTNQTVPRVVFPAYDTPIGATFYRAAASATYGFPAAYAGGAFVTLHGSWHKPAVPCASRSSRCTGTIPANRSTGAIPPSSGASSPAAFKKPGRGTRHAPDEELPSDRKAASSLPTIMPAQSTGLGL